MVNSGCLTIKEFQEQATLTVISEMSLTEGSAHDVILFLFGQYRALCSFNPEGASQNQGYDEENPWHNEKYTG